MACSKPVLLKKIKEMITMAKRKKVNSIDEMVMGWKDYCEKVLKIDYTG
jgi:hypothetical protein